MAVSQDHDCEDEAGVKLPVGQATNRNEAARQREDGLEEKDNEDLSRGAIDGRLSQDDTAVSTPVRPGSPSLGKVATEKPASSAAPAKVPTYSSFSKRQKQCIVLLVASAGFFSPISSNIFFPAINQIASDLHESSERINLSVTVFLIFQAISPSIWGSMADVLGRRPIYLSTLLVYIASCIGLARTTNYGALMGLRCIQAAGGSSVVAIAQGTIGDIASPHERAGYISIAQLGPMSAPALGPVLGAVLAQTLGWHAIFWFLAISCSVAWIGLLLFLPETLRSLVGDGSHPASTIHRPLSSVLFHRAPKPPTGNYVPERRKTFKDVDFLGPIKIMFEKDIACLLAYGSIVYMTMYTFLTSFATDFRDAYNLSTLTLGWCFLPNGVGTILSLIILRKLQNRDFRTTAEYLATHAKTEEERKIPKSRADIRDLTHFPIERARLRSTPYGFVGTVAAALVYAWCTQYKIHIAVPLIASFFFGLSIMVAFQAMGILAVDCYPTKASSATASVNLARCILGAVGVSTIGPLVNAVKLGPAFSILIGIQIFVAGGFGLTEWRYGMRWRQARARRIRRQQAQAQA